MPSACWIVTRSLETPLPLFFSECPLHTLNGQHVEPAVWLQTEDFKAFLNGLTQK